MVDDEVNVSEDFFIRPGMYFNPQTEVIVIVDDSPELDGNIFNMEEFEGAELVQISEEVPVDREQCDRILEEFQIRYHAGGDESISATAAEQQDEYADPDVVQEVGRE